MASAQAQAFMMELRANRKPERPLSQVRAEWDEEAAALPLPEGTELTPASLGGVSAEWATCGPVAERGVILLLHGGGYRAGSLVTHRGFAGRLSRRFGLKVYLPDYRLAPEHPYPAALDDALSVFAALGETGVKPPEIVLVGDSAGGGLAIALMLALRDRGLPPPGGAVLMSPWTDLECSGPSYQENIEIDPFMSRAGLISAAGDYRGSLPADDPRLSPIHADLAGLPPMLVQAGGGEIMLSDAVVFAERARAAGSPATLEVTPEMSHVFQSGPDAVPEIKAAFDRCAAFVASVLDDASAT